MSGKSSKQDEANLIQEISFKEFLDIADKYIGKQNMGEFSLQYKDMQISFSSTPKTVFANAPVAAAHVAGSGANATEVSVANANNYKEVKSTMVGTLYTSSSPTEEPYISVGSTVKEGQTIFIIEAMKVMSHFKSPHSGVVKEILVHNEETVEYGKVLVRLE